MTVRLLVIVFILTANVISAQTDTFRLDNFHGERISDTGKVIILTPQGDYTTVYTFHHGKKEGKATSYFKNGKIYWTMSYKNGKRNGEAFFYHSDGQLYNYQVYKNDTSTISIQYYPSGAKKHEGRIDSNGIGHLYKWSENGRLEHSKINYPDSIVCINYYDNGKIKDKNVEVKKTQMHYAKLWDKKGRLLIEQEYMVERFNAKKKVHRPRIVRRNIEYKEWDYFNVCR